MFNLISHTACSYVHLRLIKRKMERDSKRKIWHFLLLKVPLLCYFCNLCIKHYRTSLWDITQEFYDQNFLAVWGFPEPPYTVLLFKPVTFYLLNSESQIICLPSSPHPLLFKMLCPVYHDLLLFFSPEHKFSSSLSLHNFQNTKFIIFQFLKRINLLVPSKSNTGKWKML